MARRRKRKCPYGERYCDGLDPQGEMMCPRCYDDLVEKEHGVEFATAEEAEALIKQYERRDFST